MRHLMRAVVVLLFSAGLASAGALADNDQFQGQFDGGIAGAGAGIAGQIGGGAGFQVGYGFSAADPGDYATENQFQQQGTYNFSAADDGAGNFASTETITIQGGDQFSESYGGFAGSAQGQAIVVGTAGLTVGGQFGVAGSAGAAIGASGSAALGGAQAQNGQTQVAASQYEQQSVGANSFVYQAGQQEFGTATGSGAALVGVAGGAAGVYQAGGSVAVNDGNAGFMDGSATAAGEAWAVTGSAGIAGADAEAFGNQEHMYEQGSVSADGSNFQYQQGYVSTQVQAQSTSP